MAPSFDPQTNLFYVNAQRGFSLWYLTLSEEGDEPEGHQGGATNAFWSESELIALDYQTGKARWVRKSGGGGDPGILTTAGHLLFTGDGSGNLLALDPANGEVLWHVYPGGTMNSSPMTYELDGRQYVLTAVDGVLYAWSLPARKARAIDR